MAAINTLLALCLLALCLHERLECRAIHRLRDRLEGTATITSLPDRIRAAAYYIHNHLGGTR